MGVMEATVTGSAVQHRSTRVKSRFANNAFRYVYATGSRCIIWQPECQSGLHASKHG